MPVLEEVIDLDCRALELPVLELVVVDVVVIVYADEAEPRELRDTLGEADDDLDRGAEREILDDVVDVRDELVDAVKVGEAVWEFDSLADAVGVFDLAIVTLGNGDAVIDFVVIDESVRGGVDVPVLLGTAVTVFI